MGAVEVVVLVLITTTVAVSDEALVTVKDFCLDFTLT